MIGYPAKAKDLTLPSAKLTEVTAVVRSRHACTTGGERDGRRLPGPAGENYGQARCRR